MGFLNKIKKVIVSNEKDEKSKTRNFKYLDKLIHKGLKEVILDADIILGQYEESHYKTYGIKLDVNDIVIDGNGHTINARGKTPIFNCSAKNITIKNITLKNGQSQNGGAVYNTGKLTIENSELRKNKARYNGGAIHNKGELKITQTKLTENDTKNGGAISNDGGELTITESKIISNTADYCGAIENKNGNFKIFNCEISSNKSKHNIISNGDSLQVFNSYFRNNQTEYNIITNYGNASIFHGELIDNNAQESILYNNGKYCIIEKTIFENDFSNENSKNIINKSELTLKSPQIKNKNRTVLNEGYILLKNISNDFLSKINGEGVVESETNIIPNEEKIDFGYLDKKIHESATNEIMLDEDVCLQNYERDYYEGGIELDIDNLVIDGNGKTIDGSDKSRIFLITGNNITLKNITFKNGHSHKNYDNLLNSNGGSIKINRNKKLTIENCEFLNNISEVFGGAIYNNAGELNITNSTLNNNQTNMNGSGGAIYNNAGELNITNSTLNNNQTNLDGSGGAIFNHEGKLIIIESILSHNTSKGSSFFNEGGGAIYNTGDLNIEKSTLNNNKVDNEDGSGGAIWTKSRKNLNLKNCNFENNTPNNIHTKSKLKEPILRTITLQ